MTKRKPLSPEATEALNAVMRKACERMERGNDALERAAAPWQNIDTILDVLEKAGCCRDGYVNAPEDVVANALRDWLQSIQPADEREADKLARAMGRLCDEMGPNI